MASARFDVLGIGNAIVDVIARAEEDFLLTQGMRKGAMALIDETRAHAIYDAMGPAVEISGGSAANTIVGVAGFGARAAFVGKIKDDQLGRVYRHDIRAAGVSFATEPAVAGPSTGRCYVLVTPDGERTMNTYLGAAQDLNPSDIDAAAVAAARSSISKAICGTRKAPRKRSSRRRISRTRPGARWRCRCRTRSASIAGATSSCS